jgi:hypothetical protein
MGDLSQTRRQPREFFGFNFNAPASAALVVQRLGGHL